jgi:hypothetical protein
VEEFKTQAGKLAGPYNAANKGNKAVFDSENFKIENFKLIRESDGNEATTVVNEATTTTPNGATTILIKSSSLMCTLLSTFVAYNL